MFFLIKSLLKMFSGCSSFYAHFFLSFRSQIDAINGQSIDKSPNNPDLIGEYLMRTREPPAIFQPSAMMTYNPLKVLQQKFVNMAYKHPQLLIDDEKDECEKIDSESDEQEIADNYDTVQNQSRPFKLSLFNSSNGHNENHIASKLTTTVTATIPSPSKSNTDCRLIGNVKPNLIKTWEQLNSAMTTQSDAIYAYAKESNESKSNAAQHEYMNPMLYLSNNHILFDQKMPTTSKQNESFVIKRSASHSGHFYDSIDNESVVTQDDDDQMIASLCDLEHGGEAMAEYISLMEKKEKLCWSIDSCNWKYKNKIHFLQQLLTDFVMKMILHHINRTHTYTTLLHGLFFLNEVILVTKRY